MPSMQECLNENDVIGSVRLELRNNIGKNKIWVIVEGDTDLKLFRKGKNIYFPIKEFKNVLFELNSCKIMEKEFQKMQKIPSSYKDLISIPESLQKELPTSYDIIGKIVLIKLNLELRII